MGKAPAEEVRIEDERRGSDGRLCRVVRRMVRSDHHVTIACNVYEPIGGIKLRFIVLAADGEADFHTPPAKPQPDEFEPA